MAGTLERGIAGIRSPTQLVVIRHGVKQDDLPRVLGPGPYAPGGPAQPQGGTAISDRPRDCPECESAGSVVRGLCQVCYAELDEAGAADLPPAGPRLADRPTFTHRSSSV